jgi:hypothetical protein
VIAAPGTRLTRLYLVSRRAGYCLLVLVACAIALRIALHWITGGGTSSLELPLVVEAGAAAAIGVTTRSPFGESELVAGRWLPFLRLGTALALTAATIGVLAAGSASAHLFDGTLGVLRDTGGFIGIALLTAALAGGALAWIGPLAYLAITVPTLTKAWTTPWLWVDRPPHDRGAAVCAAATFIAGIIAITIRGARDPSHE